MTCFSGLRRVCPPGESVAVQRVLADDSLRDVNSSATGGPSFARYGGAAEGRLLQWKLKYPQLNAGDLARREMPA